MEHIMRRMIRLAAVWIAAVSVAAAQYQLPSPGDDEQELYKSEARRYAGLMQADHVLSDTSIDVTYYKLDLSVTTSPDYLQGSVVMNALSRFDSIGTVTLDLMNAMTVDSVLMSGMPVSFMQQPTTVTITLDRNYGTNELFSVEVFYRGVPGSSGFGSFEFSSHSGTPWVWSLSEPYGAKDWWPCKDHPSDKADSADVWVTVNSAYKVGSNGKLTEVLDNGNGTKTYKWAERYPISTYLISVAITNYAEFSLWFHYSPTDSMEVLNYVLPENLGTAQNQLPRTLDMLQIYSDRYGLYPFIEEKYGHSQFGWGGGMEHQTMTSLSSFGESLVAHELAHMWFGDMITCANWPNIWMNEGFATYSVAVYYEGKYGSSNYWSYMNSQMSSARNANGTIHVQDTSNVGTLFSSSLVYAKGATVLHMLRHVVGDSVFYRALKSYANDPRFQYGIATTESLKDVFETESGQQLGYFFNEWIYGEKYPRYTYWWYALPDTDGGSQVRVSVSQTTGTSNPSFFTMPIDFKLSNAGWDTTVVLFNTVNNQQFAFRTSQQPTSGTLDPQGWILKTATQVAVAVDEKTIPAGSFTLEQNYPNPFNPSTTIRYQIPEIGHVRLQVFDVLGREVATLVNDDLQQGEYEATFNATGLSSGIYYYRLESAGPVQTRQMLLLK